MWAARWRVIGVGSPASGDDLGWRAVDALRESAMGQAVELVTLDRPGPALLDYLGPEQRVILIDAMCAGLPPGTVRELSIDEVMVQPHVPSTHDLGLAESLALARALGLWPRNLHLIGIEPGLEDENPEWRQATLCEVGVRVRALIG